MLPVRIANFTRFLGAPAGWKDEGKKCGYLAIRDIDTTVGPAMESAWEFTPDDIARINAGAKGILTVCGQLHPPVSLRIGPVPSNEGDEG